MSRPNKMLSRTNRPKPNMVTYTYVAGSESQLHGTTESNCKFKIVDKRRNRGIKRRTKKCRRHIKRQSPGTELVAHAYFVVFDCGEQHLQWSAFPFKIAACVTKYFDPQR